jgi:LmbE family N-acetylglucosaminyl deacetylase
MAIAAHPGDAIFSMGPTVAQHIYNGGSGVLVSLSLGEKGARAVTAAEYGQMQRDAMNKAAKTIGAVTEFLTYPDAEIPSGDRIAYEVCDLIRKHRPRVVVTHWQGSWHKDHQNTFLAVRDAVFYGGLSAIKRDLPAHFAARMLFAENWEDSTNFRPDMYLDITAVYGAWIKACEAFPMWEGGNGKFRYRDHYQSLAAMRGTLAGCQYAVTLMKDPGERGPVIRRLD